jgi:hypothetical protein
LELLRGGMRRVAGCCAVHGFQGLMDSLK